MITTVFVVVGKGPNNLCSRGYFRTTRRALNISGKTRPQKRKRRPRSS